MSATPHLPPGDFERRTDFQSVHARECAFASANIEVFSLGALEGDEAARVERHVSSCPRCARQLDQAASVTSLLPFLADSVAVPETALAGIFARIEREQPVVVQALPSLNPWETNEPVRSWTIPSSKDAYAASLSGATLASSGVAARKRRVNWDVWAAPLAAMPLVLALAIVGGWALNTRANLQDQKSALQAVKIENQQLSTQVLAYRATNPADNAQAAFNLVSVDSSGASGALKQLSNNKNVSVNVWDLPTGITACEIELEAMDGQRTSAGMLTINSSGAGNGTYSLALPLDSYRMVHVVPVASDASASNGATGDLLMAQINANLGDPGGTAANPGTR